jgi:hypothetical protein
MTLRSATRAVSDLEQKDESVSLLPAGHLRSLATLPKLASLTK